VETLPRLAPLSVEQFLCFQATCADLRAMYADRSATTDAIERLYTALSRSTPSDWRLAVRAVEGIVRATPIRTAPSTQRLKQFVAENGDLLAT
jgi:hypothetical protein